jgi:hypothetical protein
VLDFLAIQSDLSRDSFWQVLDTNKRLAELLLRITNEAARAIQIQANESANHLGGRGLRLCDPPTC